MNSKIHFYIVYDCMGCFRSSFITARNSSCGKVMFSHVCIIPSVHGGGGGVAYMARGCMHGREGMCGEGVCGGGHARQEVCGRAGAVVGGGVRGHCSGRYASY